MRFLFLLIGTIAIALGTGFGLSYFALDDGRVLGALRVGPWAAWPAVGSPTPDPYTQAYLSRTGALQLGQSEGIAFTAISDSDGQPLDRSCRYRLEGSTPVASFWTLAALAPDGSNIARPDGTIALQSRHIARANDGTMVLYVSKTLAPDNWLEITGTGPFKLLLTLYDTSNLSGAGTSVQTLPSISKEGCAT